MENIKKKLQSVSDEMLESMQSGRLDRDDMFEWYGYLRAIRDTSFELGLLNESTIQENLLKGCEIIRGFYIKNYETKTIQNIRTSHRI